ncbi:MAG: YdcH family protein [Cypionkella sp.]
MPHTPHELAEDFPGKADAIHALREEEEHFRKLTDTYHEVNRALHRAETRIDAVSEDEEIKLRRQRLLLKDQIAARLV